MMNEEFPEIQFLGAAGTVTGSKFLMKYNDKQILVDCGLFQGLKELRLLNWEKLPVDCSKIDTVILTHGHLDHVGYLPKLIAEGYSNKILCTGPTARITEVLLLDSAKIQEEDAHIANEKGYSKHKPAKPLYTVKDAKRANMLLEPVKENNWIELSPDIRFRLKPNGHILGACFVEMDVKNKRIVFSGDIGRRDDLMLEPPFRPSRADYVIMESTYGDRHHPEINSELALRDIILRSTKRNGILIIPSFTVDRAQDLIWMIYQMEQKQQIPNIPIYLDSPMGVNVSKIFCEFDKWHKLGRDVFDKAYQSVKTVRSAKDSFLIAEDKKPKIIIAGSGMMTGGRVLIYLQEHISNPDSTIMIAGYQAVGTRGRIIQEGGKEIKIHGQFYRVKAHIEDIGNLSSHGDQDDLVNWLGRIEKKTLTGLAGTWRTAIGKCPES